MKHSGTTLIFVIVWAAVLFASFVIGICIREVRFQYAKVETKANTEPEASSDVQIPDATDQLVNELAQRRPMPSSRGAERPRNLSSEGRAGAGGERMARMGERFEGMSEEERQEAIAQMRERFGGRRRGGGERFQNLSEEERAKMEEERRQMRERFENMSDEEREAYRTQMRERFGGRRSSGGREGGRRRSGDGSDTERQEND